MTNAQATNESLPDRGSTRDLLLAGVASCATGVTLWGALHATVGDPWLWQGGAAVALMTALAATARATRKHKRPSPTTSDAPNEPDAPNSETMAALKEAVAQMGPRKRGRPRKTPLIKTQAVQAPAPEAPKVSPIERERERLRAAGFSEAEISQIMIARESQSGGFGQGVATGVLNNLRAIVDYGRSLLPSFKNDLANMLDSEADAATRIASAASVTAKTAAVVVFGYFVYLEALQLRSAAYKAWAEACIERQKNAINFSTLRELESGERDAKLNAECKDYM